MKLTNILFSSIMCLFHYYICWHEPHFLFHMEHDTILMPAFPMFYTKKEKKCVLTTMYVKYEWKRILKNYTTKSNITQQ